MEGSRPLADPAPSNEPATPLDQASAEESPAPHSQAAAADGGTFAHTKQHVADREVDDSQTERFVNTKLNIALINDPKNGPRFTLTKRESGLGEPGEADTASTAREQTAEEQVIAASSGPSTDNRSATMPHQPAPPLPTGDRVDRPAPAARSEATGSTVQAQPIATGHPSPPPLPERPLPGNPASTAGDGGGRVALGIAARAQAVPSGVPPAATPPSKVPVDSSKTFVGPNGTYYDESWRWMDWRGTRRSWNWPAACSFGHWFAYRRLYPFAALHLLWLGGLAAAVVNGVPILALIVLTALFISLAGVYGNILYFLAFRRAVDHVTKNGKGSYQELKGQLAAAGGTSTAATGVMGGLSAASIIGALVATFYLRGSFAFNFWPF